METDSDEADGELKPQEQAEHEVPVEDRNGVRRARAMQVDAEIGAETAQQAIRRNAGDPVPPEWEEVLSKQGGMDELLEDGNDLG